MAESYQEWKKRQESNGTLSVKPVSTSSGTSTKSSGNSGYEEWKRRNAAAGTLVSAQEVAKRNAFQSSWGNASKALNSYMEDASDFFKNSSQNYFSENKKDTAQQLQTRGRELLNWVNDYSEFLDESTYNDLKSYLNEYDTSYGDLMKFYSNFNSDEEYQKWDAYSTTEKRQATYEANLARLDELKKQKMDVGGLMTWGTVRDKEKVDAVDAEIAALEAEINMYKRGITDDKGDYIYGSKAVDDYSKWLTDPKYAEYSGLRDYGDPTIEALRASDAALNEGDLTTFIRPGSINDPLGVWNSASDEERKRGTTGGETSAFDLILGQGMEGSWNQLTEDEVGIYYTIMGTQGKDAAMKYLDDMQVELNRRAMTENSAAIDQEFAEANSWERFGMSAKSIPTNLIGGGIAFIDDAARTLTGQEINPYSSAHSLQHYGQRVRSNQAKAFDENSSWEIPGIGFSAGDLYQAAMSTADMFAGGALGPTAYGALMGMGAASSEAKRLYEMGASKGQITAGALAAGAAEMVFEKYSIEKLITMKNPDTLRQLVINALKQGGVEAWEEGATELANIITNRILMTSESDWAKLVEENNGDMFATHMAAIAQIGEAAAGGFVSGFLGGGASSTAQSGNTYLQDASVGKSILDNEGLQALQGVADVIGKEQAEKVRLDLQKQSKRMDGEFKTELGKNRTAGRLYRTAYEAVQQADKADLSKALAGEGYSKKTADKIADAFYAQAVGMDLDADQRKTIEKYGKIERVQQIVGDMLMDTETDIFKRNQTLQTFQEDLAETTIAKAAEKAGMEVNEYKAQLGGVTESNYQVSEDGKTHLVSDPGKAVDIVGFDSFENGKPMLRTSTGESVAADDVSYASEADALVYETVASLPDISTDIANKMIPHLKKLGGFNASNYSAAVAQAYQFGLEGYSLNEASAAMSDSLGVALRNSAWGYGRNQRKAIADADQAKASMHNTAENRAKLKNAPESKGKYKKVTFEGDVRLNTKRKTEIEFIDYIASKFSGNRVHVYESYRDENGKYVYKDSNGKVHKAPNGKYVNNEIWLDLNAGDMGEGLILNTFSHEMYHHIKKWSPKKAQLLAEFLVQELGMESVDIMVANQIAKAEAAGHGVAWFMADGKMTQAQAEKVVRDRAMEDFVADSLETMFTRGDIAAELARLKQTDTGLFNEIRNFINKWVKEIKAFYNGRTITREGAIAAQLESFEKLQKMFAEALVEAGENYQTTTAAMEADEAAAVDGQEMTNEESFQDSATAVMYQIRPPYSDGSKAFNAFVEELSPEAKQTFDLFYGFYQRSRITNTVSVSGKRVKAVNVSALYLLAQDWNDMVAKEPKWAEAAQSMADFLPADVRKRMNMNDDGTLNPTTMEKEFKMPSSMAQRLVDALPFESISAEYNLDGKTITLPEGKARQSVGGESYRRAVLEETRKLYHEGKLKKVGIGTMSKDRWGSLGFLAANGKTGASGDFTTVCPQMMFNRGCWYCYRRAAMEKGVNNKLVAQSVWYTGEILRIKDSDIEALNKNGGLRIQSFGDWMPHFSAMLADVLYDAELRGLQVKIITKEPSMINYIGALRDQGIGKNLYFNLSADYTIERGPAKQAQTVDSLDAVNPERPYMRDQDNSFWWKRAMTVEEAAKYREKYSWVNTRIVATDVGEFIRGLKDSRVDVVTGYHGNIRGIERIDSTTGIRKIEVEALGDAGMPRFAFNPNTGEWFVEYEGKTATHKRLAQAIADNGLQWEYYIKTCCITGRCATCSGKCGALARDFNVKNATNRDTESVAYWQRQMEYAVEPEYGDMTEVHYSDRIEDLTEEDVYRLIENSNHGEYALRSFVPVRRDTPPLLVELSKKAGLVPLKNLPIIMNVEHIQQCMDDEVAANDGKRGHALTTDDIIKIVKGLDDPKYVFFQKDNKRYCEVVEYETGEKGERALAIVTYAGNKNQNIMNGYPGVEYNILVTAYPPDAKYWRDYQKSPNNVLIYDKTKDAPQRSSGSLVPSLLNGSPFATKVTQPKQEVKGKEKLSDAKFLLSERSTESVSNRSILANAFEEVAQNDKEWQKLQEYRDNIAAKDAEEQKLRQLRDEIRELSFTRGPKDKQKLSALREAAQKAENRLNIYDKRLLRLEAAKPLMDVLEREKAKAYDRAVKKGKERIEETVEKLNKSELRKKIRKTIRDLDKILNRGDKKRNVKEGMRDVVEYALASAEILFTDTYTTNDMIRNGFKQDLSSEELMWANEAKEILNQLENVPKVNDMDNVAEWMQKEADLKKRLSDLKAKLKNTIERERNQINGAEVSILLTELAKAYKQMSESKESYIWGAYDADVYERLMSIAEGFGTTKATNMTLDQLDELYDAYKMVLTTVRNANKMFAENIKESRDLLAAKVMLEVRKAGGDKRKWTKAGKAVNAFSWNNEKPIYAFERIGSATLTNLYHNIRKGQDTWAIDMMQADLFRRKIYKKYGFSGWDMSKRYEFTSSSGATFGLDLQQIMSLYAYSKREQAHDHLLKGGFVFDGNTEVVENKLGVPVTYMVEDATAYNLSADILADIVSKLSEDQKAFVDEMQNYLSTTMGNKGNEVSMQLYGIRLFKEQNYFPLRSAGQYMERAREANLKKEQGQVNLVSSGFTKSTTPNASNPVVLSDFMDVWAGHVNEMSNYHAFVLPMEDFRRVYNYSTAHAEGEQSASVNEAIQNAYGTAATAYIDQLYRDLNGGAVSDSRENLAKRMVGLFKKGAVMASWSVVFQQPSAIGRAFALIDPKYFGPLPITRGTVKAVTDRLHHQHEQQWAELKKYAPVAMIKEMGYFDTGMGQSATDFLQAEEYNTFGEKVKGFFADSDYRDEILTRPAAVADEMTWLQIWNAVKNETAAKHPGMDRTSEAFLKLAGERFSEIIDKTQVYDSVLARSGNMRSKNLFMNMLTSFMAEPTTSANMVEDAIRKGRKGDVKQAGRIMGAVAAAIVINSALASIIYAARDDDDDETYAEKYISSFLTKTMEGFNPLTYYPFVKDIWSAFQGFDVERADMSVIVDLADTLKGLTQIYSKDTSGMNEEQLAEHKKQVMDAWLKALDSVTALGGIPMRNIRRDLDGAINMYTTIKTDVNGRKTTAASLADVVRGDIADSLPVIGWMPGKTRNKKLYDAIISGDDAYVERLQGGYKDEDAYHSAIRKALRDYDTRIREAAIASNSYDYDTYLDIVDKIVDEGNFDRDDVIRAIRSEAAELAPSESTSKSKAQSLMSTEQFARSVAMGDFDVADTAMADIIATAVVNGKTEDEAKKSFESSARSELKDLYLDGDIEYSNVVDALVKYSGMKRDDAEAAVNKWKFEVDTGVEYSDLKSEFLDNDITASNVQKYLVTYGGYTAEKAQDTVKDWTFEKNNGWAWSERSGLYKEGEISKATLRNALMSYGGLDADEADYQIEAYDWQKAGYSTATASAVEAYNEYCANLRVPKDIFLEIRKFANNTKNDLNSAGKPIRNSAVKKIMAQINSYNLTSSQKTAIAQSMGWSASTIRRHKLWK